MGASHFPLWTRGGLQQSLAATEHLRAARRQSRRGRRAHAHWETQHPPWKRSVHVISIACFRPGLFSAGGGWSVCSLWFYVTRAVSHLLTARLWLRDAAAGQVAPLLALAGSCTCLFALSFVLCVMQMLLFRGHVIHRGDGMGAAAAAPAPLDPSTRIGTPAATHPPQAGWLHRHALPIQGPPQPAQCVAAARPGPAKQAGQRCAAARVGGGGTCMPSPTK
jgi:hypothetical protein